MKNLKKIIFGISLGIFSFSNCQTQNTYPASLDNSNAIFANATPDKSLLSAKDIVDININSMMNDVVLKNANWGFVVYDPKTNKIVSSYNENAVLIPASTNKLITTDAALNVLGEKFLWTTQLEYSGNIDENGVLQGDLYIVGSGDPTLGTGKAGASTNSQISYQFLTEIQRKGIQKIAGNIYIQTALFEDQAKIMIPENIIWKKHNNYYLPIGNTSESNSDSEIVANSKKNYPNNNLPFLYISPISKKLVYNDKYFGSNTTQILPDAPSSLANNLKTTLVKNGIYVSGKVLPKIHDPEPEKRIILAAYHSPSIANVVIDTNLRSDNALAEGLLKYVGFIKKGNRTTEAGREVVTQYLNDIQFDTVGFQYQDGSGLSRSNLVTPMAQVKFLTSRMKQKYYKTFFDSLPTAGQTGTLKKSFAGIGNGQIFAKTGTLNKVKTLAGYIKTNSGRTLAFSLMINNYTGSVDSVKNRMERILQPTLDL